MMLSEDQLRVPTWECVHFTADEDARRVRRALSNEELLILDLEVGSPPMVLAAVGKTFRFPDYYGQNWDALDECLRDLAWLAAPGYVVFVQNATELWSGKPHDAGKLVEAWLMAARKWARSEIPFHLIFIW